MFPPNADSRFPIKLLKFEQTYALIKQTPRSLLGGDVIKQLLMESSVTWLLLIPQQFKRRVHPAALVPQVDPQGFKSLELSKSVARLLVTIKHFVLTVEKDKQKKKDWVHNCFQEWRNYTSHNPPPDFGWEICGGNESRNIMKPQSCFQTDFILCSTQPPNVCHCFRTMKRAHHGWCDLMVKSIFTSRSKSMIHTDRTWWNI